LKQKQIAQSARRPKTTKIFLITDDDQLQTGDPVVVEHDCPPEQHSAPRPPCGGHARSREQHCAVDAEDDALITHTESPPPQQRSPHDLPAPQHTPPSPPAKPDGL
jgi:hypothetical protein